MDSRKPNVSSGIIFLILGVLPMIISLPKHFHLYRDFVKVCSRLAFGAYMYVVMIKIVFSKAHHKNIRCGC